MSSRADFTYMWVIKKSEQSEGTQNIIYLLAVYLVIVTNLKMVLIIFE